jgi:hypothetical protein
MQFKITAASQGSVGIGKFTFTVATTSATITNVILKGYDNASCAGSGIGSQGSGGQIGTTLSTIPNNVAFSIAPNLNAVQVGTSLTYCFELTGTVSPGATSYSAVTTLNGDASASPATLTAQFASLSASNFVWSPNATTTAATSTGNDWTNSFAVPGLPSGGLFQNRTN